MVLYKRKPVIYQNPPPLPEDTSIKVWHIPETKEWFYKYDEYLQRIDYYMKRKFVCEITGNSCFTYFEALESEKNEMEKVEKHFPEPLKEPVLRFVQFSTVPRLDLLVDLVYSKFKNDFYPGENVLVRFQDTKKAVKIKEKARFNAFVDEFGLPRPGYCSYRVSFDNNAEITVDESSLSRDRSHFTKWYVKTFIKLSVSRSSKIGAPWVVREQFASKYRIPMEYPAHLQSFAPKPQPLKQLKLAKKRPSTVPIVQLQAAVKQKAKRSHTYDEPKKFVPLKVKPVKQPNETVDAKLTKKKPLKNGAKKTPLVDVNVINVAPASESETPSYVGPKPPLAAVQKVAGVEKMAQLQSLGSFLDVYAPKKSIVDDLQIPYHNNYSIANYKGDNLKDFNYFNKPLLTKIPEFQACISEALQSWLFFNVYHNALIIDTFTFDDFVNAFKLGNVKNLELLHEIFCSALSCIILGANENPDTRIKGYEYDLKADPEYSNDAKATNGGKSTDNADDDEHITDLNDFLVPTNGDYENEDYLLITIPPDESYFDLSEESDTEGEEEEEEEEEDEKTTEDSDDIKQHVDKNIKKEDIDKDVKKENFQNDIKKEHIKQETKRSRVTQKSKDPNNYGLDFNIYENIELVKNNKLVVASCGLEEAGERNQKNAEEEKEEEKQDIDEETHNAAKYLYYRNISWQERLYKRNFKDGGWIIILVGVLSLVQDVKKYKTLVSQILEILAPKKQTASPNNIQNQFYNKLPLELKIKALNLLCELLVEGKIIRSYIDNAMEEATKLRRDRLDIVREYKAVMEDARDLNAECITLLSQWKKDKKSNPVPVATQENDTPDATDGKNKRRRRNYTLRVEATEDELAFAKVSPSFKKKLDERTKIIAKSDELRIARKKVERKLVEIDCPRIRQIGKDNLFNRYWWFEHNGLPILGKQAKSLNDGAEDEEEDDDGADIQEETYLMGRLWVSGPSFDDNYSLLNIMEKDIENYYLIKHSLEEKVDRPKAENQKVIKPELVESKLNDDLSSKLPLSFIVASREIFDLQFSEGGSTVKDKDGNLIYVAGDVDIAKRLLPAQRKLIEERPLPLLSTQDWRYYDSKKQIDDLIKSLNPWGKRESNLRKELINLREAIFASIQARRKALLLDSPPEEEQELQRIIENTCISETESENDSDEDVESDKEKSSVESEVESEIENESLSPLKRRTRNLVAQEQAKIKKVERKREAKEKETGESSKRLSKRELKRKLIEAHMEKKNQHLNDVKNLISLQQDRERERCIEWVNSCAKERLGHTHYEGPPKPKITAVAKKRGRK